MNEQRKAHYAEDGITDAARFLMGLRASAGAATSFKPGTGINSDPASAQAQARPFCDASQYGLQPALSFTIVPAAAPNNNGPTALPACGGYLRRLLIEVVGSGGGGTTAGVFTVGGDAPQNIISQVRFLEPNNTPVLDLTGENLWLCNIFGGYTGSPDPRNDPDYSANGSNPNFQPFIPIEIDTTGRGALADLSSSSAFQLFLSIAGTASVWSTNPNPMTSLAINTYQDYWTLPNPVDQDGRPQATSPPFPGTIQLWSQIPNVSIASTQRVQLNRMGNQLRTVIAVFRNAGARAEPVTPGNLLLRWDDVILLNSDLQTLRKRMRELIVQLSARDTGVYVIPYNQGISRFAGGNGISSYLPTVSATRWEISMAFASGIGTVDFVVNEVTSAPISGIQRTTTGGGLQYYPPAPSPGGPGVM